MTDDQAATAPTRERAKGGCPSSPRARVTTIGWTAPVAAGALAVYVGVATFPDLVWSLGTGLDLSWAYAVNVLPHTDLVFGRDVVFTYGPLGYLLVPTAIGSNVVQGAILRFVTQLGLVAIVVGSYRKTRNLVSVAAFSFVFLLAVSLAPAFEYRLLLLLALILGVSAWSERWSFAALSAAALLATLLLFAKFNTGLAALGMVAVSSGALVITRGARLRQVLTWVGVPYVLGVAALAVFYLRTPGGIGQWLEGTIEIVRGYPSAMAVPIPSGLLWLGLIGVVALTVGIVAVTRADRSMVPVSAALIVLVLIALRHSFTRSGHAHFAVLLASSSILVLLARGRGPLRRSLLTGLVLVPVFLLGVSDDPVFPVPRFLDPEPGWRNLRSVFTLDEVTRDVRQRSAEALMADSLPPDWVADIRASRGVDAVPAEIAFMPANDLPWIPNPILQTYQAYTRSLDATVAAHFRSGEAPPFLLAQFVNIDGRHPMLDAPATWRAIVGSYEMDRYADLALLRRRTTPLPLDLRVADRGTAEVGSWIDVPSTRGYLFLSARFHDTLWGRLTELFWRLDPVLVDLRYADNRVVTWRILPTTAENGLLVAPLPSCFAELVALMEDRPVSPVLQIRFRGPGTGFYEGSTDLVWLEAPGALRPQGTSGGVC